MPAPVLTARDRLLVLAPHPDDETLAAGMLVQHALAAGARVHVAFATDGDNNPWPQRWLERRWRIGEAERVRWGARRREEARAAVAVLGAGRPIDLTFLGWPDQGLTDLLMADDGAVARLARVLDDVRPTHLVFPDLGDRHPDHSALHVMTELAIARMAAPPQRHAFTVHAQAAGGRADGADGDVADPVHVARKRTAMAHYASQLALSRGRLLALADRPEHVRTLGPATRLPAHLVVPFQGRASRHRLCIVVACAGGRAFRAIVPMPSPGTTRVVDDGTHRIEVHAHADRLVLEPGPTLRDATQLWAKAHRTGQRLFIFDRARWCACGAEVRMPGGLDAPLDAAIGLTHGG
jgi:LmbE family N-acetylglucosaminyl deacetylase